MDGGGAVAAFAAHHRGGLTGKSGKLHVAVRAVGDVFGERGFTGAGIAEQAKHLRRAVLARLGLEPVGNRPERVILMG
jgi:hypothetical protein